MAGKVEQAYLNQYGAHAKVRVPPEPTGELMTLEQMLQWETLCPVNLSARPEADREDYLRRALAAGGMATQAIVGQ